jgi:hypothetical protein
MKVVERKMIVEFDGLRVLYLNGCDKVEVKEGEDDRMGTWVSHLIKR